MRHAYLFAALVPGVAIAACSSGGTNFPGTGGAASTQATTSGTGNATGSTSSTTGSGGATTGSTTSTGTGGTSTSSSGTTTTTSSSTSASSAASSSGTASGACTDAADTAQLAALGNNLQNDVQNCAEQNLEAEPATKNCIKQVTMLSDACVTCFDNNVQCAAQHCLSQCIGGMSTACTMCLHTNCTPAFNACSGLMGP